MPTVVSPWHPFLDGPFPRAFAHRGWHLGELAGMENSLAAFRRAAAEGYQYLETDVRATRDGVVVAQHDATLALTTNNRSASVIGSTGRRSRCQAWPGARTAGAAPVARGAPAARSGRRCGRQR